MILILKYPETITRVKRGDLILVFLFFLVLNAGIVMMFVTTPRKELLPLEIFLYWCLSSILVQNYAALQTMNFKTSIIPDQLNLEFAHFLNRTVLYPVLSLLFLHTYKASKGVEAKLVCFLVFSLLMYVFEYLSGAFGVFVHVTWKEWWAVAFGFLHNLILIGVMEVFRKKLLSGGAH